MDQITKSIDKVFNQNLTTQSPTQDKLATSSPSPLDWEAVVQQLRAAGAAEWEIKIIQMAQDMRQDLSPAVIPHWREKLSGYKDKEIYDALMLHSGEFFPSVVSIINAMDRARERRYEEKQAQPPKEEPGKVLATQADWDEMKRKAREIFAKADKSNDLQLAERNRKAQAQSRVLGCESK